MKTSTLCSAISIALFAVAGTAGPALAGEAATDATAAPPIPATESQTAIDVDLPAGTLAAALDAFSAQSGLRLDYPPGLVAGRQARALRGHMTWLEALVRLLQGTGLGYRQTGDSTVIIQRAGEPTGRDHRATSAAPAAALPAASNLQTITVTGTRIRGGSTPSPVITIGSEQMQEEGFTDLGEVIRSIPQNFSGGQNPGVVTATGSGNLYNQNATGGSSLNLRGIGPDATLTLLNGRRLPNSGFGQAG